MVKRGRSAAAAVAPPTMRLDQFFCYARFFKSRTQAAAFIAAGRVRVGGAVVGKAHYAVRVGDVLTFPLRQHVRVVRVLALPGRRGPPAEARGLYEDLNPPPAPGRAAPPSGVAAS